MLDVSANISDVGVCMANTQFVFSTVGQIGNSFVLSLFLVCALFFGLVSTISMLVYNILLCL
jgi:hypothetical protein